VTVARPDPTRQSSLGSSLTDMPLEQTRCDWCYGPIDSEDRNRSRELGIDAESLWACISCIDAGRVFEPPEFWDGGREDWPVEDIRDQIELAEKNVEVVLDDIDRSTGIRPRVTVDAYMNGVRIAYHGDSTTTPAVSAHSNPDALAETAEYLQDHIIGDIGADGPSTLWPICPIHDRLLHAEVHDGTAVWWCHPGNHLAALVGELGLS
jgi:hypothetical protein